MKLVLKKSVLILFFFFFSVSMINAQDWSKVKKVIEEMNRKMGVAMVANDIKTVSSFYADDIISLPDYKPALRGVENVIADYKKDISSGFKYLAADFKTTDLYGSGDLAVEIGEWNVIFKLPGETNSVADNGKYVVVWQKQADNSWKIKTESWNTDTFPIRESESDMSANTSMTNTSAVEKFFSTLGKKEHNANAESYLDKDHKFHFPIFSKVLNADEHKKLDEDFMTGFSDAKVILDDVFAADDKVVVRGKFTGTHDGVFNKIPATGKKVNQPFIAVVKLKDGKNIEEWVEMDTNTMMKQLGLVPEPIANSNK